MEATQVKKQEGMEEGQQQEQQKSVSPEAGASQAQKAEFDSSGGVKFPGAKQMIMTREHSSKCPGQKTNFSKIQPNLIVIHNTAGAADAAGTADFTLNGDRQASYHLVVDGNEVVQVLPLDTMAWHTPGVNDRSIGVEIAHSMCYDGRYEAAEEHAVKVVRTLMSLTGINDIGFHRQFSSTACPHRIPDDAFESFKARVRGSGGTSGGGQEKSNAGHEGEKAGAKPERGGKAGAKSEVSSGGGVSVGSKVKITGSNYATGQFIPAWVKQSSHVVSQISGNRALLGANGGICSWVYLSDLQGEGGVGAVEAVKVSSEQQNTTAAPEQEKKEALAPEVKPAGNIAEGTAEISVEQLQRIYTNGASRAADYFPHFRQAMSDAEITTKERLCCFIAQLGHESGEFRYMEEIADGSAYEGRSDLGNTQPGDGRRFKGRGPIQVTGRHNYTEASKWLGIDLVNHPEMASDPAIGFRLSAWYWVTRNLNSYCDSGDFVALTRKINGGTNGLQDRQRLYNQAKAVL